MRSLLIVAVLLVGWRGLLAAETADHIERDLREALRAQQHSTVLRFQELQKRLDDQGEVVLAELINDARFEAAIAFEAWLEAQRQHSAYRFHQANAHPQPAGEGPGAAFAQQWADERAQMVVTDLSGQLGAVEAALGRLDTLLPVETYRSDRLRRQALELEWQLREWRDRLAGLDPQRLPVPLAGLPHGGWPGPEAVDGSDLTSLARALADYWNAFTPALAACRDAELEDLPLPAERVAAARAAWAAVIDEAVTRGDFRLLKPSLSGPHDEAWRNRKQAGATMQALVDLKPDERSAATLEPLLHELAANPVHMDLLRRVYRR